MASAVKALQQYLHNTPKRELRKRLKNDIYFFCKVLLGREFHSAQKKIIDAVISEEHDIITASCGRRFGKSEAMNSILEFWGTTKKRRDYAVIAPTYDQSKIIFTKMIRDFETNPLLSDFIGKVKMIKPKSKEKEKKGITLNPYPKIEFINGSTIVFRSAERPDNLRGWSYHAVILDEAAFIEDNVVSEVIEPMLMDYGGQLIKISTPFGKSNHFYESFIKGLNSVGGYISFKFPSWVNPYIDQKWLERKKSDLGETNHTWLQEYCAEFLDDVNTVFNLDSIMRNVAEIELVSEGLPNRRYATSK
jgi:phage terminase large subunit